MQSPIPFENMWHRTRIYYYYTKQTILKLVFYYSSNIERYGSAEIEQQMP